MIDDLSLHSTHNCTQFAQTGLTLDNISTPPGQPDHREGLDVVSVVRVKVRRDRAMTNAMTNRKYCTDGDYAIRFLSPYHSHQNIGIHHDIQTDYQNNVFSQ